MDAAAIEAFLGEVFPAALAFGFRITRVDEAGVELRLVTRDEHLRPGGTVSGPTLMTLADTGAWLVVLSRRGPLALAVTTGLEIHFLRRPRPGELVATTTLLKLGRRLAVANVDLSDGDGPLLGRATVTYALPEP